MTIEIQNFTARKIDENFLEKIIHTTIQFEKKQKDDKIYMSVALVGVGRMESLNRRYHKEKRATDVLSFSGGKDFMVPKRFGKYLGEIILCPKVIQKQALRTKVAFEKEFAHVLVHGTLHLLGWEHERSDAAAVKMHTMEEKMLKELGVMN